MSFCRNCGKEVDDGAKFCAGCGATTEAAADVPNSNVEESEPDDDSLTIEDKPKGIFASFASWIYSALGTLLLIAFITNPGEGSHQLAVAKGGGFVPTILMNDGSIPVIVAFVITSKNYLVFSLTKVKRNNRTIGIGAFGCVYLFASVLPNLDDDDERQARSAPAQQKKKGSGTFTDSRDGKSYDMTTIGTQTWMGENLNYAATGSVCYGDDAGNCAKYGRLYNWSTAKQACPAGWHLPSDAEWTTLTKFVGSAAGKKLKSTRGWGDSWDDEANGTDEYGFSALPGGRGRSGGGFYFEDYIGHWWSATEDDAGNDYFTGTAWYRTMQHDNVYVSRESDSKTYLLHSVRCVQDISGSPSAPAQQNNTGSAQSAASGEKIDNRLVGKWCDWGEGDDCFVFRANGTFLYIGYEYDNDADGTKYERIGRWSTVENKITMTFSNGDTTVETYSIKNTDDRGITGTILDFGSGREKYGKIAME